MGSDVKIRNENVSPGWDFYFINVKKSVEENRLISLTFGVAYKVKNFKSALDIQKDMESHNKSQIC